MLRGCPSSFVLSVSNLPGFGSGVLAGLGKLALRRLATHRSFYVSSIVSSLTLGLCPRRACCTTPDEAAFYLALYPRQHEFAEFNAFLSSGSSLCTSFQVPHDLLRTLAFALGHSCGFIIFGSGRIIAHGRQLLVVRRHLHIPPDGRHIVILSPLLFWSRSPTGAIMLYMPAGQYSCGGVGVGLFECSCTSS